MHPRFESYRLLGDALGAYHYDATTEGADLSFLVIDGTPSGGPRVLEPLIEHLVGRGNVVQVERQVSRARSFGELGELHVALVDELRAAGVLRERVIVLAYSYGAQVALEMLDRLASRDSSWSPLGCALLFPFVGPRDGCRGEVPGSERLLAAFRWLPSSTLRWLVTRDSVRQALEAANPGQHVPVWMVGVYSTSVWAAIDQAVALTAEELGLERLRQLALPCPGLALIGTEDPYWTVATQGRHAEALGIDVVEVSAGHQGHWLRADDVGSSLRPTLQSWSRARPARRQLDGGPTERPDTARAEHEERPSPTKPDPGAEAE